MTRFIVYTLALFTATAMATVAAAQINLDKTRKVDKSGNADHTVIQDAINDILMKPPPRGRWTVLIYAGVYEESVFLDESSNDIDLVGADRDAVIIKPPINQDGITIRGDGVRNNTISNLTVITDSNTMNVDDARGILIEPESVGGSSSDIHIADVRIRGDGTRSIGIFFAADAEDCEIRRCDVRMIEFTSSAIVAGPSFFHQFADPPPGTTEDLLVEGCVLRVEDGDGITAGNNTRVQNCVILGEALPGGQDLNDTSAIRVRGTTGLRVSASTLRGRREALRTEEGTTNVVVENSQLIGTTRALFTEGGDDFAFRNSLIFGDERLGRDPSVPPLTYSAVIIDESNSGELPGRIVFESCNIRALANESDDLALPVAVQKAPAAAAGPVQFINCEIRSDSIDEGGPTRGILAFEADSVAVIRGRVTTIDDNEREDNVFDLVNDAPTGLGISVSGTEFSKWTGPIGIAERPVDVTQTTVNVSPADDDHILAATSLGPSEQEVAPDNQPDVARALVIAGSAAGMDQNVILIGTNAAGARITEILGLNGTQPVEGNLAFNTVTRIILPPENAPSPEELLQVGTTSKLGLQYTLAASSAILQFARKSAAANSYTIVAIPFGAIDPVHSIFDVPAIAGGDSYEWRIVTGR